MWPSRGSQCGSHHFSFDQVERDGGDVEFIAFDSDTGVLQIRLVGSCRHVGHQSYSDFALYR